MVKQKREKDKQGLVPDWKRADEGIRVRREMSESRGKKKKKKHKRKSRQYLEIKI